MKVFVVYAHPEKGSFNAALHQAALGALEYQGHEIVVSDLYRMGFNPVASSKDFFSKVQKKDHPGFRDEQEKAYQKGSLAPEISREQEKLAWCDLLILQFPLWWFSMPAILKGWLDRVLTPGFAYSRNEFFRQGRLRGRKALVLLTTGGSQQRFSRNGLNGPIDLILFPIHHGTLHYVGFEVLPPFVAWQPSRMSNEQRSNVILDLQVYLEQLDTLTPLQFPSREDSDEDEVLRRGMDWASLFNLNTED